MIVTTNIVDGTKQIWFLNKDIEIIKFVKQSVSDEEVFDWFAQAVEKEKDVLYKDRDGDPYAEDAKWWKYCPNCFEPIMSSKEDEVN